MKKIKVIVKRSGRELNLPERLAKKLNKNKFEIKTRGRKKKEENEKDN